MITGTEYALAQDAVTTLGLRPQVTKCIEELGELISALAKYGTARENDDNICEEIADVQITLNQMKVLFGVTDVEEWEDKKIQRLAGIINDAKKKKAKK